MNLEFVCRAALENHLPFWACIQAVAHVGYREPTDATLRVQAYSALAYGATGIEYFTYFTPARGNYRLGAIDPCGHRTATWDALRRVNQELKALAPVITGLVSTGVYHYPDVPREGQALSDSRLIQRIDMTKDEDDFVPPAVEPRYLVGEFRDGHGRPYLLLVNKDLEHSFKFEITFRVPPEKILRINPNSGREEPFGFEQNWLTPGGGVLLRLH
jgi:hypothetical protein